jgi:hypothetical protein
MDHMILFHTRNRPVQDDHLNCSSEGAFHELRVPSTAARFSAARCLKTGPHEALHCGAVPIVTTPYYRQQFGAPFPVVKTWAEARLLMESIIEDEEALTDLRGSCIRWYSATCFGTDWLQIPQQGMLA